MRLLKIYQILKIESHLMVIGHHYNYNSDNINCAVTLMLFLNQTVYIWYTPNTQGCTFWIRNT